MVAAPARRLHNHEPRGVLAHGRVPAVSREALREVPHDRNLLDGAKGPRRELVEEDAHGFVVRRRHSPPPPQLGSMVPAAHGRILPTRATLPRNRERDQRTRLLPAQRAMPRTTTG